MAAEFLNRKTSAPLNGGFKMEGYWIWCGSVIKGEDGNYHIFASRWSKEYTMHPGWIFKSEIVRGVSEKPEGPYEFQEVVLPERGAEFWDGRVTHNPFITKHGDTYILYYTGTTFPFTDINPYNTVSEDEKYFVAQGNKRVGIATAKSIFGPWNRQDAPILPARPGKFDSFLTSNPTAVIHEDGSALLVYKARRYIGNTMGPMTLAVAKAHHYSGPYSFRGEEPLFSVEREGEIEDPFIWYSQGCYYIIGKDMKGEICGEKHGGIFATSEDGVKWKLNRGVLAYSRNILWDDGERRIMGSFERPFLLFEKGIPTHIFAATGNGPGGFSKAKDTWNMVIPLIQVNKK